MKQLLLSILVCFTSILLQAQIYSTNLATAKFVSDAPLEIIKAESNQLRGVIDISKKKFAFKLFIKTFDGFNSPLQKEHFYENYMEVKSFPEAVFQGKILEEIEMENSKSYRAKGILSIHGLSNEVIINVDLGPGESGLKFKSAFEVPLKDYEIELPRIVYQKIAEIINVEVSGELTLRQ
ncbi:MAG: YceI family protein [Bacteroidota bacterium]